ncbi:MAG: hypothetical protein VYE64_08030 [Planctomycetota bacterium]|jgi:hypothetical protein|nr:hypothetical protein [Planctomycetota bacterium]
MSATMTETISPDPTPALGKESTSYQQAPKLSHRALTATLVAMCIIPVVLITVMFFYLPQVHEGDLEASVSAEGLPPAAFYQQRYSERPAVPSGDLVIRNESDQDWTHLNIQVNRHYQIYEREPIPAGEERRFQLHRFVSRTGATFDLRYNPLNHVRIYARRPTKDRATYSMKFDWETVE